MVSILIHFLRESSLFFIFLLKYRISDILIFKFFTQIWPDRR